MIKDYSITEWLLNFFANMWTFVGHAQGVEVKSVFQDCSRECAEV